MSNFPDNMDWAAYEAVYGGKDYETPEPTDVTKFARSLAAEMVNIFDAKMKAQFPGFALDWSDKPSEYIEDGLADLAYSYVSICEREREQ